MYILVIADEDFCTVVHEALEPLGVTTDASASPFGYISALRAQTYSVVLIQGGLLSEATIDEVRQLAPTTHFWPIYGMWVDGAELADDPDATQQLHEFLQELMPVHCFH